MKSRKLTSLGLHLFAWPALFLLFSCHVHVDAPIDNCHPFLGVYHAEETYYNPATGFNEVVEYDFEVVETGAHRLAFLPLNSHGFYGTPCTIEGDVFHAGEVEFPINVCSPDPYNTYEFSGIGTLSHDGYHLHLDFHIEYCTNGFCVPEPDMYIDAYRI
ncbi:MAG: hypothetical protein ACRBFS_18925 [Aureispira sp.]